MEETVDLSAVCRLCMTQEDELVPIFNKESILLTLKIMACVALEVFEGDGLPDKICIPCQHQLDTCYSFRKKCEVSDLKLRHLISIPNNCDINRYMVESVSPKIFRNVNPPEEKECLADIAHEVYILPDATNIILQTKTKEFNKNMNTVELRDNVFKQEDNEIDDVLILEENQDVTGEIVVQDFETVAQAVKNTLLSHSNLNLPGELQMKVNQHPGKPTQVEVTTENGTTLVVELMTEDDQDVSSAREQIPKNYDDAGQSTVLPLKNLSQWHAQQRGFSCGICEKWFPTRSALVRHERIHTGERPFHCQLCQKSFAQKEILVRHLRVHNDNKKTYNCSKCFEEFAEKQLLRAHLSTHSKKYFSDIRVFYCTLCPKVFCHASGLTRHIGTHKGKIFMCRDCDKSFTDKVSLKKHHRETMHQM